MPTNDSYSDLAGRESLYNVKSGTDGSDSSPI